MATHNGVIIIDDWGSIAAHEAAKKLSQRLELPIVNVNKSSTQATYQLVYTPVGLVLRLAQEPSWGDIYIDFCSAALSYRKQYGGGKNEPLAKAIGIKTIPNAKVLDCTAGMGKDAFVMASVGACVTMLERSPTVAALLEDGLIRGQELPEVQAMTLLHADAIVHMQEAEPDVDVVYLDPMFPHKKKSALVKKEMRAFQSLLGADIDSEKLLSTALNFAKKRVVVKRPASAPPIKNSQGRKVTMQINMKKHRFDVYIQQ